MIYPEILNLTIPELKELLNSKDVSYSDIVEKIETQINKTEEKLNSYITLTLQAAKKSAKRLDRLDKVTSNQNYLFGIPISVKDTFTTRGVKTTVASKMLRNFVPKYDATAYRRLKANNTILIGKTNMDEFAHGFTTEYSAFGPTHNPWDLELVPGGSSGGSAASVASRTSLLSLASENFGSIVQPSALCGVVGMKPTYGRSSRYGIVAMASSMECPGIIGKCVEDVAMGISSIIGKDRLDATSVRHKQENFYKNLTQEIKGSKIAVVEPLYENVIKEIRSEIDQATSVFKGIGVEIEFIDWYELQLDQYIYDILYRSEVASNLARYDGIRYGFKPESHEYMINSLHKYYLEARDKFGKHVKRQIVTDPISISNDGDIYHEALRIRRKNKIFIDKIFENYDAILTPATTFISLKLGDSQDPKWREKNRNLGKLNAAMMCPTILYGYPSISFPSRVTSDNKPIGMHLYSDQFKEQNLLNLAFAYQEETGLKCLKPCYKNE